MERSNHSPSGTTSSPLPRLPAWVRGHPGLWLAMGLALALKLILELSGVITFNSDEGVMTVMARHILRGELPIFHYGQSYMGTVENFIMALVFGLFGQSVFTARIGVIVLYSVGVVGTTYLLAWRLTESRAGGHS
jgi:predicted membrane-bound mannosyltransferase